MRVVVSHPGLQHSHQLAWALHERSLLKYFYSGVPVCETATTRPVWMPAAFFARLKTIPVPKELRRHPLGFQLLLRIAGRLPSALVGESVDHRVFHAYDLWFSRQLPQLGGDLVVAYENSAYHTFQVAKSLGMTCVLDAASFHHTTATKWGVDAQTRFRDEINRRKNVEVERADIILTCSPVSAESYIASGVPSKKVKPMLLGADISPFFAEAKRNQTLQYVFAGALRYLKSIDILLSVFRRLHVEGFPVHLTLIGGISEPRWFKEIAVTPNATYQPHLPQSKLFEKLAMADCLLLPSRFDSFGMVVAEAMACGTPAVVSTQVGAKALIEAFPSAGWIVEPDADSLYACLRAQLANPECLFQARSAARDAAAHFTWAAYRDRIGQLFEEIKAW